MNNDLVKSALPTTNSLSEDIEGAKNEDIKVETDFGATLAGKSDYLKKKIDCMQQKDEVKVKQTLEVPAFIQDDLVICADGGAHLLEDLNHDGTENEKTPEQIVPSKTFDTDCVIFGTVDCSGEWNGKSKVVDTNAFNLEKECNGEMEAKMIIKMTEETGLDEVGNLGIETDEEREEEDGEENEEMDEENGAGKEEEEEDDSCLFGVDSRVYAESIRLVEEYEEMEESLDSLLIPRHGKYEDDDEVAVDEEKYYGKNDQENGKKSTEEEIKDAIKINEKKGDIHSKNDNIDNDRQNEKMVDSSNIEEIKNNEYVYWKSDVIQSHLESCSDGTFLNNSYNQIRSFSITAKFDEKKLINDSYNSNNNQINFISSVYNYSHKNLRSAYEILKNCLIVISLNFLSIMKYFWISLPIYFLSSTIEFYSFLFNIMKQITLHWLRFTVWLCFLPLQISVNLMFNIVESIPMGKKFIKIIKKEWNMFIIEKRR